MAPATYRQVLRMGATALAITIVATQAAIPPVWWDEQEVLTSTASANDYAAANVGQLKAISAKAITAMNATLPGGAGVELNQLLEGWRAPPAPGVVRNDFAAVTQGQLKAVARLFYDRLAQLNYTGQPLAAGQVYPWTESTEDDLAHMAVNLGQLKFLFSFELAGVVSNPDADGDGLPDDWEDQYFGRITISPAGDADNDGRSNLQEYAEGTDPSRPQLAAEDTDGDGLPDAWELRYCGTLDYYAEDQFNDMDGTLLDYYQQGRVPYFNIPAVVDGLRVWYDANLGGVFNANYSRLRGLVDLSGNGLHLDQPDPSAQAVPGFTLYGDIQAVFSGTEWLSTAVADVMADSTDFTVFAVINPAADQPDSATLMSITSDDDSGFVLSQQGNADSEFAFVWSPASGASAEGENATVAVVPDELQLVAFTKNGPTQQALLNGGVVATTTVAEQAPTGFATLRLGGAPDHPFHGRVAEILIYNRALSPTERKRIEKALVDRYQLDDSDRNGLPDTWEREYFGQIGVDPDGDADGDAILNGEEYELDLNPNNEDTDGDGVPEGIELQIGTDPIDPDSYAPAEVTWVSRTTYDSVIPGTTYMPDGLIGFHRELQNVYGAIEWTMTRNGTDDGDGEFHFKAVKDLTTYNTWFIEKDFGYVPWNYGVSPTFAHWSGYREGSYAYVHGLPLWYDPARLHISMQQRFLDEAGGSASFDDSLEWTLSGTYYDDEGEERTYTDTFSVRLSHLIDPVQLPGEVLSYTDSWYVQLPVAYRWSGPDTATSEYRILVPEAATGTIRWFEVFSPADDPGAQTFVEKQWVIDGVQSPVFTLYTAEEGEMTVELLDAALRVDANRDGVISTTDAGDLPAADKPFRFWINDDDDISAAAGNDIPDQDAAHADFANGAVDSVRDLVDFFPVYLDIKDLIAVLPAPEELTYRLKHGEGALNFVYTNLTPAEVSRVQRELLASGFGPGFDQPAGSAPTQRITAEGVVLSQAFITGLVEQDRGVILVEGRAATDEPLVLSIERNGVPMVSLSLPLSISGVESMFRHVNLTDYAKEYDGDPTQPPEPVEQSRINTPANLPDTETNGKYFVFVHGYNVDGQQARGWQSEVFKRLHTLGSRTRFVGVTWHGATGLDYHKAVFQAFQTGDALNTELAFTAGSDVTIAAHSLGNMVVSHAIQSGGFIPSRYYLINAAVPIEAYSPGDVGDNEAYQMTEASWDGYHPRLFAPNWYELFPQSDKRSELTWKNAFIKVVPRAYN
ncbi:MAG: LamG-like jellyroll fold domain-containing protein, partial [Opitutaceae bacterium]